MFIKDIIQSIPTYMFSIFLAPKVIIEVLHSKIGLLWWTNNKKTRGCAMMAWDLLCFVKGTGGMGFSDMHMFNLALLGGQVWRLITQKDTLCFKGLSVKYFSEGDVFRHKHCDKPSFT